MTLTTRPASPFRRGSTIAIAVVLAVAVFLILTGCSTSDSATEENRTPAASSTQELSTASPGAADEGASELAPAGKPLATKVGDEGLIAKILRFERSDGFLTVFATVENPSPKDYLATRWIDGRDNMYSLAGSYVVDWKMKLQHAAVLNDKGACVCTQNVGSIDAGQTIDVWAKFVDVSEETTKVDLQLANFPLITGVEIPPAPKAGE
ncbi:hypothetical protein [Streptomyces sp. NPDC050428]|uniref:hypothetical protein n=1 Tax=Streptomyces sp. NPDC050428 TaxID=3155757 RepID=UPI0034201614